MKTGVTFIIPTLNAQRTLSKCLASIEKQKYPRNKIEVLMLDGGSTDKTCEIAKSYKNLNLKFIRAGLRNNMEARRQVGFKKAKFDIVCVLDSDNYIGGKDWISRMEAPLRKHRDLVGSFTLHYDYDPKMSVYNRYVALFGGYDPVSYYLEKTDRLKWTVKSWNRSGQVIKKTKDYTILEFHNDDFPTLGSNGFMIRRDFVHHKNMKPKEFFHTDILYDLLEEGKNSYAVVDVPVVHETSSTAWNSIKKRVAYMTLHHIKLIKLRRYKVFNKASRKDQGNLLRFIVYTTTLIIPVYESIEGYLKVRDLAWFYHPVICWLFLIGYSYAVIKSKLVKS